MADVLAEPTPSPRRRRWPRAVAIAVAGLLALIVGVVALLHTPPVRRIVLSRVTSYLAQQQIGLEADNLRYNLANLSIELRNARLRSLRVPDAPVFATIPYARVDVSLLSLLRRRYVVESAVINDADVYLRVDESGRSNLPVPPSDDSEPSSGPVDFLLQDVRLQRARVRYEDRTQQIDLTLPVQSITIVGHALTSRHDIVLAAGQGALQYQGRSASIDRLDGRLDLGQDDLSIDQLILDAAGARVELAGDVARFDAPELDATIKARLDAARLAVIAGIDERVTGTIDAETTVKGPASALDFRATVNGRGLSARDLRPADVALTGGYDMGGKTAEVSNLRLTAPWGEVTGTGTMALTDGQRSSVKAVVRSLEVAELMQTFQIPYTVASRVDLSAGASWPGLEFGSAAGEATMDLRPTRSAPAPNVVPVGGRIRATARDGQVVAYLNNVRALGAEIGGRVSLADRESLDGAVRVRVDNLARLVPELETFLGRPRGTLLPTALSGGLTAEARLDGTIAAPLVAATVSAPSLTVGTVALVGLSVNADYTTDAVRMRALDVAWEDARLHADGTVGLEGRQPLQLTFGAQGVRIESVLAALGSSDVPAIGLVEMNGMVGGTIASPTARVDLSASGLSAYQEPLGTLTAAAGLTGRQVEVSRLVLEKPQTEGTGRLDVTATYHLDRETYAFKLASDNLRLERLTLPDGTTVRGDLSLAAAGSGTVPNPSATARLAADALQVGDIDVGPLAADVRVADRQARLEATVDRYRTALNATVGTERPFPAQADVKIAGLELDTLPLELDTSFGGELTMRVEARGDLAEPGQGTATATIDTLDARWNGQPMVVDGPAVVRYANERLAIDTLKVTAQDSTIEVTGDLPLREDAAPGAISVDARLSLASLAAYAPQDLPLSADGRLTLDGTVRGTLRALDPDLTLTIENALLLSPQLEPSITDLQARATVKNGEAVLEALSAAWGSARFDASGRAPLSLAGELPVRLPDSSGPATVRARVTGLDPAAIPGAPPGLSGLISVSTEVTAPDAELATLKGEVRFDDLRVGFNTLDLSQQQPSRITLSNGVATIEQLSLAGSVGNLAGSGSIGLTGDQPLDLTASGTLNLAAISAVTDAVRAEGPTKLELTARGSIAKPDLGGFLELTDGNFALDEPRIGADDVRARLDLAGPHINLTTLTGNLNGGTLSGSGVVTLGEGAISDIDLQLSTEDFAFDAPLDLRSLSDATIRVTRRNEEIVVEGKVTVEEGGLTGDVNFDTGILAAASAPTRLDLTAERNPLLESVRFNVAVVTDQPLLVDNNLAVAEVTANLRVLGTPYETGLAGRLELLEGGEITLNERRYEIERGVITFTDETRISPSFDLRLNTTASRYDITLAVNGPPGETETSLTADPSLPEPDIMALLVTGRTLEEMRGEEFDVAREQVLSYLAGRVSSQLGRGIERATGLSEVRVEPNLIANEEDPSARLTVGQDLTDRLTLIYSTDLTDSNNQVWVTEYDITSRFETRAVRQFDNSYRFDFRHDVRFGGSPAPKQLPRTRPTIGTINVSADGGLGEAALRDMLGVETGDDYDFFSVRDGVADIEQSYREHGWLQARVRLQREVTDQTANLSLTVRSGPKVDLVFDGIDPPTSVREEVALQWNRGVFDGQRTDDGREVLRAWLMSNRYLNPSIKPSVEEIAPDRRRVVFHVNPGTRFEKVTLAFEGARGVNPSVLRDIVSEQQLEDAVFTDPIVVTELLERFYREQGYLDASIEVPEYEFGSMEARVVLRVNEGPLFHVNRISFTGNTVVPTATLLDEAPLLVGDAYLPAVAERSVQRIRSLYWRRGYNDVRLSYQLDANAETGNVHVAFTVKEGQQSVVAEVVVEGNDRTSNRLVREQLELETDTPLDLSSLGRSRRNLYDTGAFSIVDITRGETKETETPAPVDGNRSPADESADGQAEKLVRVTVSVREVQPFQLRYGASFDTERGPGGIFEISSHNSLGKARVLGLSTRYDSQVRSARLYLSQPSLKYFPLQSTATAYIRDERNPLTEVSQAFNVDRRGVSIQQERQLGNSYVWSYGYRYERARRWDPRPGGVLDETTNVSPLTSTFTRETRDDVLDASTGAFLAQALSYSPGWLGSDIPFTKYYGQYFKYLPLQAAKRERFTNEIIRPRLVFATGVRLGLATGIGGDLPGSERFFAGGSTTLRGFAQNAVGAIDLEGVPLGGDALLVLNNELRFPLVSIVDGVTFLDVGNVFRRVSDFSFTDLRESAGVGVRLRTPWFLVRGDYGVVLDARPGERRSRFYFSIGQAF